MWGLEHLGSRACRGCLVVVVRRVRVSIAWAARPGDGKSEEVMGPHMTSPL